MKYPDDLKQEYFVIINKVLNEDRLTDREYSMYLYFLYNANKREFSFLPKKYRKLSYVYDKK